MGKWERSGVGAWAKSCIWDAWTSGKGGSRSTLTERVHFFSVVPPQTSAVWPLSFVILLNLVMDTLAKSRFYYHLFSHLSWSTLLLINEWISNIFIKHQRPMVTLHPACTRQGLNCLLGGKASCIAMGFQNYWPAVLSQDSSSVGVVPCLPTFWFSPCFLGLLFVRGWILSPERHIAVLTPGGSECDLVWKHSGCKM